MNILIIEDEPKTAKLLREMIEEVDPTHLVVSTLESVKDSIKFLTYHQSQIDLIFMDIQLTDGVSFDIFKEVEVICPVVFCTAYDEYSLTAFKKNGIDYLLKPFSEEDLAQAFNKIKLFKKRLKIDPTDLFINKVEEISSIVIRYKDKIYPLHIKEIACLFLENDVLYAYDFAGSKHPLFKSVNELSDLLPASSFFRISRQVIVNKRAVVHLEQYFNRKMVVKLQIKTAEKIILGKTKIPKFIEWLEG